MRHKMILRLFSLAALMVLLWSCRSEDLLTDNTETPPSKFKVFTSAKGEKVDYAEGFKILMEKHDSINNEQHTAKAMQNAFQNSKNVSEEYIEFNIRSEDFISESGERWVVYPTVKNSAVTGLTAGILNKDETLVDFRELKPGTPYYDHALPLFSAQYQKSRASAGQGSKNGKCGFPGQPPCEIDVIVITPTKPDGGGGPWIGGSGGGGGPKGCPKYSNCINPDGGGAGSGDDPSIPITDPCLKLKAQNNPNFQAKINVLASNLGLKKETGYIEKTNDTFDYKDNANATEDANSLSLGDPTPDMKGFLHTHINDFEDSEGNIRKGFKMFSPTDVIYFNQMLVLAKQNGKPITDIYAVMVSGNGNYQIRFTGDPNQIRTTYTNTRAQFREMYKNYFLENSSRSNEMNFLKFIDEIMNVRGITLVKMEDDGTLTKKTLNNTKTGLTEVPCPK